MSQELHLSSPQAGLLVAFKFGFFNEQGPCVRVMVIDTAQGKSSEMLVPVESMMSVGMWLNETGAPHLPAPAEVAPTPAEAAPADTAKEE